MGGYTFEGAGHIMKASDTINDAVNLWGDGNSAIEDAWLPWNALSKRGENARLQYEAVRGEALQALHAAQEALIEVRQALSDVATGYTRAERETSDAVNSPGHRPEIDDPRYG